MRAAEFRERLLVALVLAAEAKGLGSFLDPAEVANRFGLTRRPGQLRLVVRDLEDRGLVRPSYTMGGGEDGGMDLRLTNAAVEEAEELLELHPEYAAPVTNTAPGADRYVSFEDNYRRDVVDDVVSLRAAVVASNEADEEARLIALSELSLFEATISQPRVPVELIERFLNRVLKWMAVTFGEALIGAVAGALITKLLTLLA